MCVIEYIVLSICLLFSEQLPKSWRATIQQNMLEIRRRLHPDEIALRLYASNVITDFDLENIKAMPMKQSEYIINLLLRGNKALLTAFYEVSVLYSTNIYYIYR